jgi:hypothetical protein
MAGQDLTVNIKTTSDVPQAMEKAKSATVSFAKQVEDIQKKFSTAFKDIFLGFTAPMVIIQGIVSSISSAIEKSKQQAREGMDLIAKGETAFATSDEKRMAAYFKAKKAREDEIESVRKGLIEYMKEFSKTPDGKAMVESYARNMGSSAEAKLARAGQFDMLSKLDPQFFALMMDTFKRSPEGKEALKMDEPGKKDELKPGTFKGPEGFSNVVGVGANPVLEKMTRQNEIMEEIKLILQEQSIINRGGQVPHPFTENVPLTMQKAGLS